VKKVVFVLIVFLVCGYVKASTLSLLNSIDTYSYPLKYASAKDSLVAIKDKDGSYTIYPKYTFQIPLKYAYKIHPAVCIKMREMNYGSLKNPFNRNLAVIQKIKESSRVLKKDKAVGSNVIVFKNLLHLERELNPTTYKFFKDEQFKTYIIRVKGKYYLENDLNILLNSKVKFRFFQSLNRFRYRTIHHHIPLAGNKIKSIFK
jgi:hypothetical protein